MSVWELWGALFYGGLRCGGTLSYKPLAGGFLRLLVRERVTMLNQTPAAFGLLMLAEERLGVSPDLALRYVIFAGEALQNAQLESLV